MSAEPQWFYSSLAQVTAAIVGFVGGFLLLRFLELTREWRDIRERLRRRQAAWVRASSRETELDAITPPATGPFTGVRKDAADAEQAAWEDLYEAIQDQRAAAVPKELQVAALALVFVALAGGGGPLLALPDPSLSNRLSWLVPWGVALIGFAVVAGITIMRSLKELEGFQLYPHVQAKVDEYEDWIDAMVEQERQKQQSHRESNG